MTAAWVARAERLGLSGVVGLACGTASAAFLLLLDRATTWRDTHPAIVWALPVAGYAIGWLYAQIGAPVAGGTNLVLDAVHAGGRPIPRRMAPLVLVGTVLTHLFGGSAGREGTAVQMGASLADAIAGRWRASEGLRRVLVVAGVAGGFGSVFGTPWAGAVFAVEFAVVGRIDWPATVPALAAALIGDWTCRAWGIVHMPYPLIAPPPSSGVLFLECVALGAAAALVAAGFIELTHALKRWSRRAVPLLPHRMFLGGLGVVLLWQGVGSGDYLGLGVPTIIRAFEDSTLPVTASALKLVFTSVTLATGFLGGEVTPLFFIGATMGNALARAMDLPLALGAALGLVAVFASAANAPLALSVMAVELFGWRVLPYAPIACAVAYGLSGHRSIYAAQRVGRRKLGRRLEAVRHLTDTPR